MKRFAEQLKKKSETVHMSAVQKRDLKARIVSYMEYHPLPKTEAQKNAEAYIRSEQFTVVRFNTAYVRGIIGAFAVFVFILVPVVAERAVPGDVLYPIKVNFNEEIRASLATSPYEKVEWETQRLERRIAEARLLAREGKLTEEVEAGVAAAVKQHSDAAQEGIAALRESDSDEAAIAEIAFESALTVQSEVLAGELQKETAGNTASSTPGSSVASLAGLVEKERQNATENKSGTNPSYEKLAGRIELETTRAYELFESVKKIASEEEVRDVERRLADIERKIAEAASLHAEVKEETQETVATDAVLPEVALLRTALSDVQKLVSFMTDIDVRENVAIETLVPVTLTSQERTDLLVPLHDTLDEMIAKFTAVLAERVVDEDTQKLELGLQEARNAASTSKAALVDGDFDLAESRAAQAQELVRDIELLLGPVTVPEEGLSEGEDTATSTEEVSGENQTDSDANGEVSGEATTTKETIEE